MTEKGNFRGVSQPIIAQTHRIIADYSIHAILDRHPIPTSKYIFSIIDISRNRIDTIDVPVE